VNLRLHLRLLGLAVTVRSAFRLAGWPDDDQQYSAEALGIGVDTGSAST
jgi:hypothetical protein